MASRGEEWLLTPPPRTPMLDMLSLSSIYLMFEKKLNVITHYTWKLFSLPFLQLECLDLRRDSVQLKVQN